MRGLDIRRLGRIDGTNVRIKRFVLPVTVDVFKELKRKVAMKRFDLILHLGLATKSKYMRIERRAKNIIDFKIPDNSGNKISKRCIVPKGPRFLYSSIPIGSITKRLRQEKKKFIISNSAGTYICNLLLYHSLDEARKKDRPVKIGFIHVPKFSDFGMKGSMAAIETIVRTCVQELLKKAQSPASKKEKGRV